MRSWALLLMSRHILHLSLHLISCDGWSTHCAQQCTTFAWQLAQAPLAHLTPSDAVELLQDLVFYTRMFQEEMKRDPTNVELFDMAQSNSEHRHATAGARITPLMECPLLHIMQSSSPVDPSLQPDCTATCPFVILTTGLQCHPVLISTWHSLQHARVDPWLPPAVATGFLERS